MKLAHNDKLLLDCVYYLPHNTDVGIEQINMKLKASVQQGYSRVLFAGDFNYPQTNWNACATLYNEDNRVSRFLNVLILFSIAKCTISNQRYPFSRCTQSCIHK